MSVPMIIVYFGFFILICKNLFALAVSNCTKSEQETYCCPNYYMVKGKCIECPKGTYGINCSVKCPENRYGELCVQQCNCKPEYCDPVNGCTNVLEYAYCSKPGQEIECCPSYYMFNGKCTVCPKGTYDINCTENCPNNMYGELCRQTCDCRPHDYCDPVYGCSVDQPKTLMYWIYIIPWPGIIFLMCIIGVYIRWRRKKSIPRNYVDIPHIYSQFSDFHGSPDNNVSDNMSTRGTNTIDANGNRKPTEDTESLAKGSCDEEHDTGTYNTLTLRIDYYEEPVRRKPLTRSYSDTSSLYVKQQTHSPEPLEEGIHCQSNMRRISSVRIAKGTGKMENGNFGANSSGNSAKGFSNVNGILSQSLGDCTNLNDLTNIDDKNARHLPSRQEFLKELSAQFLTLKKY